jgi:hypothetical protein
LLGVATLSVGDYTKSFFDKLYTCIILTSVGTLDVFVHTPAIFLINKPEPLKTSAKLLKTSDNFRRYFPTAGKSDA